MGLLKEKINLKKYPEPRKTQGNAREVTIGDLHANALKLLYFLIREGVLKLKQGKKDYDKIVNLYYKEKALTRNDLLTFKKIIDDAIICPNHPLPRLIGDELADRGKNDILVLDILEKLAHEQVSFEILASNHGFEFLKSFERDQEFWSYYGSEINQVSSHDQFRELIQSGVLDENDRQQLQKVITKDYKLHLKLLSYTLSANQQAITLYTHAPIGLPTIKALATHQQFRVDYNDNTAAALAMTIDNINHTFQEHYIKLNKAHKLLREIAAPQNASNCYPFYQLIWARYNAIDPHEYDISQISYPIHFVHGHDAKGESYYSFATNLDNVLGLLPRSEYQSGSYDIYRIPANHESTPGEDDLKSNFITMVFP